MRGRVGLAWKGAGLALVPLTLLGAAQATAFEDDVRALAQQLAVAEAAYPAEWPGGQEGVVEVVVTDGQEAFLLWHGQVTPHPLSDVQSRLEFSVPVGFTFDDAQHRAYYMIQKRVPVAKTLPPLALITHENFHQFIQRPSVSELVMNRGQDYPVDPAPRALRHALYTALMTALGDAAARPQALQDAAGYFQLWKTRYPDDYKAASGTDTVEGAASYFEDRMQLIVQYGPQPTPANIAQYVKDNPNHFRARDGGRDSESYVLGTLSGLLLDSGAQAATWKAAVQAGASPLDVLLGAVPVKVAPTIPSASLVFAQNGIVASVERQAGPTLRAAAQDWREGAPLLRLQGQGVGSYSPLGFYVLKDIPDYTVIPISRMTFGTSSGQQLNLGGLVWLSPMTAANPQEMLVQLAPSLVRTAGGRTYVKLPNQTQELEVVLTDPLDGHPVYVVKP